MYPQNSLDNERCMWYEILLARCMDGGIASWRGIMNKDAQAWAQFRLQGYFPDRMPCSFCLDDVLETSEHLSLSCPRVHALLHAVLHSACRATKLSVGSNLAHVENVLQWVYAAGKLFRSKHERSC